MTALAVVPALGAASCFALASALQYQGAREVALHPTLDPRLFRQLVRRPRWVASWPCDLAGTTLQAVALAVGALALVQPLLVCGLFIAILLEAALSRRAPGRRDLIAVGLSAAGLAAFLVAAVPEGGIDEPSAKAWTVVGVATAVLVVACLVPARRAAPTVRGVLVGSATGVLYGLVAALLKVCTAQLEMGLRALFTDWHVYALAVVGLSGYLLQQNAFQSGPLAAPLTALTLVDPVFSVIIGVTAFHEQLAVGGVRWLVEVVAVLVMGLGVWLTSRLLEPPRPHPQP